MNILEAIKSGKLFKRKKWTSWEQPAAFTKKHGFSRANITYIDLIADDWETKDQLPAEIRAGAQTVFDFMRSEGLIS